MPQPAGIFININKNIYLLVESLLFCSGATLELDKNSGGFGRDGLCWDSQCSFFFFFVGFIEQSLSSPSTRHKISRHISQNMGFKILIFGLYFVLYFLKLSAGIGFFITHRKSSMVFIWHSRALLVR
jgi:hypothetical protein